MERLRAFPALACVVLLLGGCGDGATLATDQATEQAAGEGEAETADPASPGAPAVSEELSPDPGGEPVTVSGTVAEGDEHHYTVDIPICCTGETVYARVVEGPVLLSVVGSDGQRLEDAVTDATIELVDKEPLTLVVTSTEATAEYQLEVGIAVSAS